MSRLTDRVAGDRKPTAGRTYSSPENGDGMPMGIRLADGSEYSLEGQPPIANSHGWGNLAFLGRHR